MTSTVHKFVVNVKPVTNPTQYTKLGKYKVRSQIRQLLGMSISCIHMKVKVELARRTDGREDECKATEGLPQTLNPP